jgi:hypothetical protein
MKILALFLCLLLFSCSHTSPICRHVAVMCGLVFAEKYPNVLIVTGPMYFSSFPETSLKTVYHAQAKVKIDNKWQWLSYSTNYNFCYISFQDNFTPQDEYTILDFTAGLLSN